MGLFSKDKKKDVPAPSQDSSSQKPALKRSEAVKGQNDKQVGTLLRSNAKPSPLPQALQRHDGRRDLSQPDPTKDTKEQRQSYLDTQKDTVVGELAEDAVKRLTAKLEKQMDKQLAAQKKDILQSAKAAVEVEIAKSQKETGGINPDTIVGDGGAWDEAAKVSHDQSVQLASAKKDELKDAADDAFKVGDEFAPERSQREKHLKQVTAKAKTLIDAEAATLEQTLTTNVSSAASKTALVNAAKGKASAAATAGVDDEVDARDAAETDIAEVVKPPVDEVAKEIVDETKLYVEKGLGAHGTGWFRSKEFKAFHEKMKAAAREKGHEKTDEAIAEKRQQGGGAAGKKAEFEYQTAQAHILTHNAAKLELRTIMKDLAGEILTDARADIDVEGLLTTVGQTSAWAALRKDPSKKASKVAAKKAAASSVKGAKSGVLEKLHTKARDLKNEYVKAGNDQDQGAAEQDVVQRKVEPHFETGQQGNKFGKKMLQQAMEAPTAGKGLQLLGKLIDAACPQVGDETELEVELKIPATHGAFCYFKVSGSAQRSSHMELGVQIGFGAGWETWGLSAQGGFLVFLKAAAADTVNAMQLLHYGAFRNLTHVSNTAANFWAGVTDPKKTAGKQQNEVGKTEQAELWAAMTEERVFGKDKNAFVEVGGGIEGGASLKAGVEGEVSGELTTARRWDQDVFNDVHTANAQHGAGLMGDRTGKDRQQRKQLALDKRKLVAEKAKRINRFKFGTSMNLEANGQKFAVGLEAQKTFGPAGGWEIELSGGIPYDPSSAGSSTLMSKIAGTWVTGGLGMVKKAYDAYQAKHPKTGANETQDMGGDPEARVTGAVLDTGEDALLALDSGGMTGDLLKHLSEANPQGLAAGEADGVNDTARLWLGQNLGMNKVMGEHGDMTKTVSDAGTPQPFGASSALTVALMIEIPTGGAPKFAFKVMSSKEMKAGGELGGGVGLTAKLTRKQELGGVAGEKGEGVKAFAGGREGWVANSLGTTTP
jgi:hypothetical protein